MRLGLAFRSTERQRRITLQKKISADSPGQIAVIYAGVLIGLLGAVALSVDVMMMYYHWALVQKAVDSSALAGVHSLPNSPANADTVARAYGLNNGLAASEITAVKCIDTINGTYACSDTAHQPANFNPSQLTVTASRTVPYYFARALGLMNGAVEVSGTSQLGDSPKTVGPNCILNCTGVVGSSNGPPATSGAVSGTCGNSPGQYDVLPIAVDNKTASSWVKGASYTLNRVDANGNGAWPDAPGNWGLVTLCEGNGGAGLRTSIANGFYGPISIGQTLTSEPGAKVGPVNQGFADLLATSVDSYPTVSQSDPRAVIVPLVDFSNCHGKCDLPVTGFLSFYVDSYSGGAVTGHFITKLATNAIGDPTVTGDVGLKGDAILIK
jgi:Flp pilus assembly protein TadG